MYKLRYMYVFAIIVKSHTLTIRSLLRLLSIILYNLLLKNVFLSNAILGWAMPWFGTLELGREQPNTHSLPKTSGCTCVVD